MGGIIVCDRWRNSFENFYADMGPKPGEGYSLDRINNDGNYEYDNVRWATYKQQCRNTRYNRLLTYNGETKCLVEWCEQYNIKVTTLRKRLNLGWTVQESLITPIRSWL